MNFNHRNYNHGTTMGIILFLFMLQNWEYLMVPVHGQRVAERIQDTFGYYFQIKGYGMNVSEAYKTAILTSVCSCKVLCQVEPLCHSVTALPLTNGTFECRFSYHPMNLSATSERQLLYKMPGAVHYLESDEELWKYPEDDGLFYGSIELEVQSNICKAFGQQYKVAVAYSPLQFQIFQKYITDNRGIVIYIRYLANVQVPEWGPFTKPIPFNATGLDFSYFDRFDWTKDCLYQQLIYKPVGSEYKIVCDLPLLKPTLCQANLLRLEV